jgi:hypothetical protein
MTFSAEGEALPRGDQHLADIAPHHGQCVCILKFKRLQDGVKPVVHGKHGKIANHDIIGPEIFRRFSLGEHLAQVMQA